MLHSKTFNKKTRGGRIQKLVREVYLRDDIYCGALFCKSCEDKSKARLTATASTILVLDTNVVLNQVIVNFQVFTLADIFAYYLIFFFVWNYLIAD